MKEIEGGVPLSPRPHVIFTHFTFQDLHFGNLILKKESEILRSLVGSMTEGCFRQQSSSEAMSPMLELSFCIRRGERPVEQISTISPVDLFF